MRKVNARVEAVDRELKLALPPVPEEVSLSRLVSSKLGSGIESDAHKLSHSITQSLIFSFTFLLIHLFTHSLIQ